METFNPESGQEAEKNEKVIFQAQKILSDMGLSLEDVIQKNRVLDLGASVAVLEQAVKLKREGGKFVSLSLDVPHQVKNQGFNYIKAEASHIPFESGQFDLIISRHGPIFLAKSKFEAKAILDEMIRVQVQGGESRIYPARFGFIKQQLFDQNSEYFNLHGKAPAKRSSKDLDRLKHFDDLADKKTLEFLEEENYLFELGKSVNADHVSSNYLILLK